MEKRLIIIGGGELKTKETLEIDKYIADLTKNHAGDKRAYGLFIPTASHDSMPYFNSFRKTYTSNFDIKADVALTVYGEYGIEKVKEKFEKADLIYIGGGDTLFMLKHWKKTGMLDLIKDAYERGVVIAGLSAGAICWFKQMYTDSASFEDGENYHLTDGLGWLEGLISPHYNHRKEDFDTLLTSYNGIAYGLEDCSALEIINGKIEKSLSCGGNVYKFICEKGEVNKQKIK